MPNSTLDLSTVELVSTLREAPMNGSPSSQDYNDSWTESLADLASLSGFINDILIPMLNGLAETIQPNPSDTPQGLTGLYVFTDTTQTTPVFYDNQSNTSLTISQSFGVISGLVTTVQTAMTNLTVQVQALQTQLSSTNQNDVAQALQNFNTSLQNLTAQSVANTQATSNNTQFIGKIQRARATTGAVVDGSPVTVYLTFPTPYGDDEYTFTVTLQDTSGDLSISEITNYDGPEVFALDGGSAMVVGASAPRLATVTFPQIPSLVVNPGDSITIASATSSTLNGTWTVATAVLATSVWTITFLVGSVAAFSVASQTAGTLTDTTEGAGAGVQALVTSSSGTHTGTLHVIAIHD